MGNFKYINIANVIEEKISNKKYHHGERIPSERELMKVFNVTRTTIRRAIDLLVKKKFLIKEVGSGTFVRGDTLNLSFEKSKHLSFKESVLSLGGVRKSIVTKFELIKSNDKLDEIFGESRDKFYFHAERYRYIDDIVVHIESTYLPYNMFPNLTKEIMSKSKYEYLEKLITIDISINEFLPIIPPKEVLRAFNLSSKKAIFFKTSIGYTDTKKVFEYSEIFFNPSIYEYAYTSKR